MVASPGRGTRVTEPAAAQLNCTPRFARVQFAREGIEHLNGTRKHLADIVEGQSKPRLRRNAAWIFGGQLFSLAVQATYFAVLARLLGLHEYGILAGVAATVSLASQFSSLGSGFVFLRHVSADYSLYRAYFGNLLAHLPAWRDDHRACAV